jgi:hypothetical protein
MSLNGGKNPHARVDRQHAKRGSLLHSLNVALARPRVRLERRDLTLPEETILDPINDTGPDQRYWTRSTILDPINDTGPDQRYWPDQRL